MYYLATSSGLIYICSVNLMSGDSTSLLLDYTNYLLDDGWLTYSDGHLYLTMYTTGLFGTQLTNGSSKIVWFDVDGLNVICRGDVPLEVEGSDGKKIFDCLTSAFVVVDGRDM